MKKQVLLSTMVVLGGVLSATSSAWAWTNDNPNANWSMPVSGNVRGEALSTSSGSQRFQARVENFYWNSTQISNMRNSSNYPTIDVHDNNSSGNVDGQGGWTTLPAAKLDVEDSAWYEGDFDTLNDEIEIVGTDKSQIQADVRYSFGAVFNVVRSNDSGIIAYAGESSAPICSSCDYNTVGTPIFIGSFMKNSLFPNSFALDSSPINGTAKKEVKPNKNNNSDKISSKVSIQRYENIKNQESLTEYKQKALEQLEKTTKQQAIHITTFNKPLNISDAKELAKQYGLEKSHVFYAKATNNEGINVSIFAETIDGISEIANEQKFNLEGITQVQGLDNTSNLKRLKDAKEVFAIEIKDEQWEPMGLYHKLEESK